MNKCFKRFTTITLAYLLLITNTLYVLGADNTDAISLSYELLSLHKAKNLAIAQCISIAGNDTTSPWHDGFTISNTCSLFDENEQISAYLINLSSLTGEPTGYIIINANQNEYPIIEFSYDQSTLSDNIDEAVNQVEDDTNSTVIRNKLYYLGIMEYAAKLTLKNGKSHFYDISSNDVSKLDDDILAHDYSFYVNKEYVTERDAAYDTLETIDNEITDNIYSGYPSEKEQKDFITRPRDYEEWYRTYSNTCVIDYVPAGASGYFSMED